MHDYLFRGSLAQIDPDVAELIRHETARQQKYLIMIPSESTVPEAVRETLASSFHNLYAEGYPLDEHRHLTEAEILDYGARLPEYRRLADKRYYKGGDYVNILESLARRRAAEAFATPNFPAEKLYVNVQPLSGAPANSAIFTGLINVGDTIMGLDLLQGGHLTHGSPVARSGKFYKSVSYSVDPVTERLDYDAIRALALEHKPRILIAGYTSYPFAPDWAKFRAIADEVGAYLMADVSHVSGLIIAGAFPSPVGYADAISFTTHKTLHGPRAAVIITHRADLAPKLDRGVFPGEQGGPHMNTIAGLAVAFRLAMTPQFHALQHQIVKNAARLAEKLAARGLNIPYGGTDTHMLLVDCKTVVGPDGTTLSGDQAARILELAGIVANRNTVPGDASAGKASAVRLGTPWITQRGFHEAEIDELGDIIADLLLGCVPFSYTGRKGAEPRARIAFDLLQTARLRVRDLADRAGIDTEYEADDYPHFAYIDRAPTEPGWHTFSLRGVAGGSATAFLHTVLTGNSLGLRQGSALSTCILEADGSLMSRVVAEQTGDDTWLLHIEANVGRVAAWLRSLSDGFVLLDPTDPYAKVPGPVDVAYAGPTDTARVEGALTGQEYTLEKAYFIGLNGEKFDGLVGAPLPRFEWAELTANGSLKTTPLHSLHQQLGAKMVEFAGYDMPVWYSSVSDEHLAVRHRAGLFDVTHMGTLDVQGPGAAYFLDAVTTNDVQGLAVGDSQYGFLLNVDGLPLDDLMIYRLGAEHFFVVVNASNHDQNWAWLSAVKRGEVQIDAHHPDRLADGRDLCTLRDLRVSASGADQRVDLALQGPNSKTVLLALGGSEADKAKVSALPWAGVTQVTLGGFDLIVSRTGYTGERMAYELFVHPDRAADLFQALMAAGAQPCGLAARDSLRIEAGLPLYGHELAGPLALKPAQAGFGGYVKLRKPYFVGKRGTIADKNPHTIARFRLLNRGARPAHQGDPVVDRKGRVVGIVTSCSADAEGYQIGQVLLREDVSAVDTSLAVYSGSTRANGGKALNGLTLGDKVTLPEPAVVLSRFPTKKKVSVDPSPS